MILRPGHRRNGIEFGPLILETSCPPIRVCISYVEFDEEKICIYKDFTTRLAKTRKKESQKDPELFSHSVGPLQLHSLVKLYYFTIEDDIC
jgi:hypothetical protein